MKPKPPANLEELFSAGHKLVKETNLHVAYPQPEIDRESFVRQVRGHLPKFVWEYVNLDPYGVALLLDANSALTEEFVFPNHTELWRSFDSPEPTGILEAARHTVDVGLPNCAYTIGITFEAKGGPGKSARWEPVKFIVHGLEYEACNLAVAAALSTGDYPKGYEVK